MDPSFAETDPRIRIRIKIKWIRQTIFFTVETEEEFGSLRAQFDRREKQLRTEQSIRRQVEAQLDKVQCPPKNLPIVKLFSN